MKTIPPPLSVRLARRSLAMHDDDEVDAMLFCRGVNVFFFFHTSYLFSRFSVSAFHAFLLFWSSCALDGYFVRDLITTYLQF